MPAPRSVVRNIDLDGLRIAYRRAGQGPALVLLHGGLGLDSREWRHQLEGLSDEFTVVAWDMPGCGFSDDPPDGFGSRDYADLLAAFIERLGLETPHVLGLSLGSLLALELYHWHGDVPRSLILASAYAGWAGSLPAGVAEQRRQKIARMIEAPAGEWVREWLPTLLGKQASDEVAQEVRAIMADFHPEGQRRLLQSGFAEIDLRDVLSQLDVPTLLLYGEVDVRSPREVAETMHVRIRGSQLVFMPGVGHLGDMEAPQLFNAEVRRFLGSIG